MFGLSRDPTTSTYVHKGAVQGRATLEALLTFRRFVNQWHLTLTMDWLAFVCNVGSCGVSALADRGRVDCETNMVVQFLTLSCWIVSVDPYYYPKTFGLAIAATATVCAFLSLFALLVTIIRTHRLKKRGLLPPPHSRRHEFYEMEAQTGGGSPK